MREMLAGGKLISGKSPAHVGLRMKDDTTEEPQKVHTNWDDLRAQAAKLGISLSQLQQQLREQELRRARKRPPAETPK
jgi:hypothetical protein